MDYKLVLLIIMLFFHLLDDYCLQGILSSMKQKNWWKENSPDKLYEYDYLMALGEHAFSWTVMVHIPAWIYCFFFGADQLLGTYIISFILCWVIHAIVDHAKANMKKISLIEDQLIHVWQIIVLWLIYAY